MNFVDLLDENYPKGAWVEKHHRAAVKAMESAKPPLAQVTRNRTTPSGKAPRGLERPDKIRFAAP
jgi:hypothetical protein